MHENTEKEGTELFEHIEEKSKCIIEENGFSRDGICQDIKSEYTNAQPLMMAEKEISDAIEKCRESCEFSDDILNNPVVYEHPENSINIAVDDVIVKKQEENREGERKAERGKRKYVHNTILYVIQSGLSYLLNGKSTKNVLLFLTAFIFNNKLIGYRFQFFTDGHKAY